MVPPRVTAEIFIWVGPTAVCTALVLSPEAKKIAQEEKEAKQARRVGSGYSTSFVFLFGWGLNGMPCASFQASLQAQQDAASAVNKAGGVFRVAASPRPQRLSRLHPATEAS